MRLPDVLIAVAAGLLLSGNPAAAQAPRADDAQDDAQAVRDALRILGKHDAEMRGSPEGRKRRQFLAPTPRSTLTKADFGAFLRSGRETLEGVRRREDPMKPSDRFPYFEGVFTRVRHPFLDREIVAYDTGVYAVPGEAAYVGNFTYMPEDDGYSGGVKSVLTSGSYVIVGKRIRWDGSSVNGIFIAEDVIPGYSLELLRATPEYLEQFERRHAAAVARQKQRLSRPESRDTSDFGALLSAGLGAALIGVSDLSTQDKLDLAGSVLTEVVEGGDGRATLETAISRGAPGTGGAGTGVFSRHRAFEAPGLDRAMDLMLDAATR